VFRCEIKGICQPSRQHIVDLQHDNIVVEKCRPVGQVEVVFGINDVVSWRSTLKYEGVWRLLEDVQALGS
jgi:hypothetical protein